MRGRVPAWLAALVTLTAVKVFGALAALAVARPPDGPIPHGVRLGLIVTFGSAALLLLSAGRSDRRAVYLGGSYALLTGLYTDRLLGGLADLDHPGLSAAAEWLTASAPDAFFPLCLCLFVRSFPQGPSARSSRRLADAGVFVTAAACAVLFAANLARLLPSSSALPMHLLKRGEGSLYVITVVLLSAGSLVAMGWRARLAAPREKRRVRVFVAGLVLGFSPIVLQVLMEKLFPAYERFSGRSDVRRVLEIAIFSCLASVPFTTAYAVLVHRVLDVRLIARRALQYALARYTVVALAGVPFAGLCVYLLRHRHATLAELFSGSRLLVLAGATALGALAIRYRGTVLDAVDRRFFREQYDARQLLTLLGEQIRASPTPAALADLIAAGIDRAFHLETVGLLVDDDQSGRFVDPLGRLPPLDGSGPLVALLGGDPEPLEVELAAPRSAVRQLPEADRHWLAAGGFQLLVPLVSGDGSLLGVIALGEKRSGLPFLGEDRQLLVTIAAAAALAMEVQRLRRHPGTADEPGAAPAALPTAGAAMECIACGRLFLPGTDRCSGCRHALETALVPYVFPGKFRLEERIGAGGMGVVYRAVDLALGRPVAIKTLRRLSPEDALRLRREARTAAAVSHPNLAAIFGVETWRATPMLILEYLESGTLSQRLEEKSLAVMETLELGVAMAAALERLHAADILHRDVKPSNIGYTRDGVAKLMDFGIARVRFDPRSDGGSSSSERFETLQPTLIWSQQEAAFATSQRLAGTVFYLPPEYFDGALPGPGFDLWSLSLVLYECLAARRVFEGNDLAAIIRAIRFGGVADIREHRPDSPAAVSDFFARNLSRHPSLRATTAAELRCQLEEVRYRLLA